MNYKNAKKILPKKLYDEVQKYIQGEYLYVPRADGSKKAWGSKSGYRHELTIRNDKIRKAFHEGTSIDELAVYYCLSVSMIKKIIYIK
jgi:Mor family transcriptional regulator